MRFIFGVGSRLFIWDTSISKVAMRVTSSHEEEDDGEEFKEAPPMDPHSTNGAHMEISPSVMFDTGKARRMGFHGSEGISS
jgi:hypothetical protein